MLSYEPLTGILRWRINFTDGPVRAGMVAGSYRHKSGYVYIYSRGWGRHKVAAQRIVWKWMTGEDPGQMRVDHANLNKHDNRWQNLRLATAEQSTHNRPQFHHSKGKKLQGAYASYGGKWRARIKVEGQLIHLGTFNSELEAHDCYCSAVANLRGDFGRTA